MAGMLGTGPAHRQSGAGVTVCARARHALGRGGGRGILTSEQELEVSRVPTGQAGPRPMPHNKVKLCNNLFGSRSPKKIFFFFSLSQLLTL